MHSHRLPTRAVLSGALVGFLAVGCGDDGGPAGLRLVFDPVTGAETRATLPAVTVEIQNASGTLQDTATADVTIALGANPGQLIFHASGIVDGDRIIELLDHLSGVVLPTLQTTEGNNEMLGLVYDPAENVVYGSDRDLILWGFDPVTGARTLVDTIGVYLKAVAIESTGGRRLLALGFGETAGGGSAAPAGHDSLYSINRTTAVATSVGRTTLAGDSIAGYTGFAFDPTSGTAYTVVRLGSHASRHERTLATLNLGSRVLTPVALLSEAGVAGITFLADGTLIAVTGDDFRGTGGFTPETLWEVDKTTGAMTSIMALGNGADGESITTVPARLTGTLTVAAVGGVATFGDLQITAPGTGFTLTASASGLTAGTSAAFNITPTP